MKNWIKQIVRGFRRTSYPYESWNHDYKSIFIHIPKCAGSSVLNAFIPDRGQRGRTHASCADFYFSNQVLFDSYFKFTFVRNPWNRLLSTYTYLLGGGNGSEHDKNLINKLTGFREPRFELFVNSLCKDKVYSFLLLKPQHTFLSDEFDSPSVDFIGRVESFYESMAIIETKVSRPFRGPLTHSNKSSIKVSEGTDLNDDLSERIAQLYPIDIAMFNYERPKV